MRNVRQMVKRVERAGYTTEVRRVRDIDPAELAATCRQAGRWRGTETERGFSMALGRFGDPADGGCVLVSAHKDGVLRAFLHFVPWGEDGLSLDLMRRDRSADPGLNELLIVAALRAAPRPRRRAGLAELRGLPVGAGARRAARRRADLAGLARAAGLRLAVVPDRVALPVQRQVPAGLGAALPGLPGRGRPAPDRRRRAGGRGVHRLAAAATARAAVRRLAPGARPRHRVRRRLIRATPHRRLPRLTRAPTGRRAPSRPANGPKCPWLTGRDGARDARSRVAAVSDAGDASAAPRHPAGLPERLLERLAAEGRRATRARWSWASSTSPPTRSPTAGSGSSRTPAIAHGLALHEQGADLVDVGGESTRPGAERPERRGGAAPGDPGRPGAQRGRGRGQRRHHAGGRSRRRRSRPARLWSTTSAAAWPTPTCRR